MLQQKCETNGIVSLYRTRVFPSVFALLLLRAFLHSNHPRPEPVHVQRERDAAEEEVLPWQAVRGEGYLCLETSGAPQWTDRKTGENRGCSSVRQFTRENCAEGVEPRHAGGER